MANQEHINILKQGFTAWNQWRQRHPDIRADLYRANLTGVSLSNANLSNVNLAETNLTGVSLSNTNLSHADLSHADLSRARLSWSNFSSTVLSNTNLSNSNLTGANLTGANLAEANLAGANLSNANLAGANLTGANLSNANLAGANLSNTQLTETSVDKCMLWNTIFAQTDLTNIKGLETINYWGPSYVDLKSVQLPAGDARTRFLRGVGYFEPFINNYTSLLANSHYSYFISHSNHDDVFAQRLYNDLQDAGIRCWFTLHDVQPDPSIFRGINRTIQSNERLLIILSEQAIESTWIEQEVEDALYQESQLRQNILFSVRLDNTILQSQKSWTMQLRQHYIGDFTQWQNEIDYVEAFATLLYHLKGENLPASQG